MTKKAFGPLYSRPGRRYSGPEQGLLGMFHNDATLVPPPHCPQNSNLTFTTHNSVFPLGSSGADSAACNSVQDSIRHTVSSAGKTNTTY